MTYGIDRVLMTYLVSRCRKVLVIFTLESLTKQTELTRSKLVFRTRKFMQCLPMQTDILFETNSEHLWFQYIIARATELQSMYYLDLFDRISIQRLTYSFLFPVSFLLSLYSALIFLLSKKAAGKWNSWQRAQVKSAKSEKEHVWSMEIRLIAVLQ